MKESIENNELVSAWIKLQQLPQDSSAAQHLMWAATEINLLALESPKECWEVVMRIFKETDDEWVLTNLAAGPIESLLSINGDYVIPLIQKEAVSNEGFRNMLKGVWRSAIPEDVWKRLDKIIS